METKEKKQVVSAITKATNILITVGVDPTVDELAALLGLSLLLGKLDKHATAVFSGTIPSAISFLEPDKTFEDTVDGLRDFIIALNKDKADHLRYKLDGDVVKIFITPYKNTIIRDTDLEFSQGDFNVELILALGTENKTDLDTAVASHGRILHDATTISFTAGNDKSDLGEIDWHAANASSLCEMLVSLARDLGENLIDEQIATALMTGIVSKTERFSNNLTTSDVMKTAATLMSLGANQQLIAARLDEAEQAPEPTSAPTPVAQSDEPALDDANISADGSMQISHTVESEEEPDTSSLPTGPSLLDVERNKDQILQDELSRVVPSAQVDLDDLKDALPDVPETPEVPKALEVSETPDVPEVPNQMDNPSHHFIARPSGYDEMDEPSMGGTLNATTEQAEEDSRSAIENDRNHVILSHTVLPAPAANESNDVKDAPAPFTPPSAEVDPEPEVSAPEAPAESQPEPSVEEALATLGYPAGSHPTLADLDQKTGHTQGALEVDDARAAVANALDNVFNPANNPAENVGSQPLSSDLHVPEPAPVAAPIVTPAAATPVLPAPVVAAQPLSTALDLPPLPPLPPLPGQDGGLPPLPPLPPLDIPTPPAPAAVEPTPQASVEQAPVAPTNNDWQSHTVEPPVANDPGQFRIPGQK